MAKEVPASDLPHRVGRYEILLPLASGGMGKVYLAAAQGARGFESEVALKLTHAHLRESPEFAEQLLEEAKLAVRIRHRNVVATLDVGDDPLGLYLVMEYVEGDTLGGLRRRAKVGGGAPLPRSITLRILLDVLAGLNAAHDLVDDDGKSVGLVHRDFTPSNILVATDGVARLTDFGIARAATRVGSTATGMLKGKIAYMAPEQARGLTLDRRTDIWAAGVVAWELIADRRLYPAADDVSTLLKIVSEKPPLLSTVIPEIPREVEEVVAKALMLDRDERWPTAAAFARQLAAVCRPLGWVAELEDVEEAVRALLGPMLAERKERIVQIRRLRAQMGRLTESAEQSSKTPSSERLLAAPSAAKQQQQLLQQAKPVAAAIPVSVSVLDNDATAPVLGAASDQTSPDIAAPITDTTSTTDPSAAPHLQRSLRPIFLVFGAIGFVGLVVVVTAIALRVTRSPPTTTTTSSSTTGSAEISATRDVASALTPSSSLLPPSTSTPTTPPTSTSETVVIVVEANAPLRSLRFDGRSIEIASPAPTSVDVTLDAFDAAKSHRVEAVAIDGRKTRVDASPTMRSLHLEFSPGASISTTAAGGATKPTASPTPPLPARPHANPTIVVTPTVRTASTRGLAPSPYP